MPKIRPTTRTPSPIVYIENQAYDDMLYVARATRDEVGWFGEVTDHGDRRYVVHGIYVPHQESNGTTVEFQPEMLFSFFDEYLTQDHFANQAEAVESYNSLRLWGHSHHTMGVSPSNQDQQMIDGLCAAIGEPFIAIRINHRGEIQTDIAYPDGYTLEDVDTRIGLPNAERKAEWEAIVKDRLKKKTYSITTASKNLHSGKGKGGGGGYGYGNNPYGYGHGGNAYGSGHAQKQLWELAEGAAAPGVLGLDEDDDCDHEWTDTTPEKTNAIVQATCVYCETEVNGAMATTMLIHQHDKDMERLKDEESPVEQAVKKALDG